MGLESIIIAVVSLAGTLAGAYFSNRRASAIIAYRIDLLEQKVNKHNSIIERTYELEKEQCVAEEQIRVINHRIADLEKYHTPKD